MLLMDLHWSSEKEKNKNKKTIVWMQETHPLHTLPYSHGHMRGRKEREGERKEREKASPPARRVRDDARAPGGPDDARAPGANLR